MGFFYTLVRHAQSQRPYCECFALSARGNRDHLRCIRLRRPVHMGPRSARHGPFLGTVVTRFGVLAGVIPFVLVALTSGFAVGATVGLAFGRRALLIAALAGALAAIAWLIPDSGSLWWSSVIAAATLAAGLVLGSICTRRIRHA